MRSAGRSTERCTCFTPIAWRRWSRPLSLRWGSWRGSARSRPGWSWATGRCATPTRSGAGSGPLRCHLRVCRRRRRSTSPSWNEKARPAPSTTRPARSPRMDVLRKHRPGGRRVTAARCPIRPTRPADVGDGVAIARAVFSDPLSENDFSECVTSGVPFFVAERQGGVAGYVVAHYGADEGEILNLGVAPAHRRQGIGRALVERVLQELAGRGVRAVYLEVRASNASARQLYESLGFGEVARRARYYRRPVEDAVVLRATIPAEGGSAKL